MTRGTAKTLLKRYGFDDSDPLLNWLDEGQDLFEAEHDWPFLQMLATDPVAMGQNSVDLPPDFFKVYSLHDMTNRTKLKQMDLSQFERTIWNPADTGKPQIYTVVNINQLVLWPVADSDFTMRIVYQKSLTDVSQLTDDATNLDGPANTHYTVVLGAAFVGLMAENEEDRAAVAKAQFDAAVAHRWQKYSDTDLDEPKQVQDVMGYFSSTGC